MSHTTMSDIEIGRRLYVYAIDIDGCDDETAEALGRRARELLRGEHGGERSLNDEPSE